MVHSITRVTAGCDYLLIFNFVLLGIGVFLITCGFSIFMIPNELENFQELVFNTSIATDKVIILGMVIFAAAFFGGLSIITNHMNFLKWYVIFISALITLEAIIGFYTFFKKASGKNEIEEMLNDALHNYDVDNDTFIDALQIKFKCCGISSPLDWVLEMNITFPKSCYQTKGESFDTEVIHQNGCLSEILCVMEGTRVTLIWIIFAVIAIELLVIIITLFVRQSIQESFIQQGFEFINPESLSHPYHF